MITEEEFEKAYDLARNIMGYTNKLSWQLIYYTNVLIFTVQEETASQSRAVVLNAADLKQGEGYIQHKIWDGLMRVVFEIEE